MAVVPKSSVDDSVDGVQLLYESAQFFDEALRQFRICHDLCLSSDIVDKPAVVEMDRCAVKFRQISCYCATLSEKVASVWCGTCITFYRNLAKIQDKNPGKLLAKISANANELSQGFNYLSECASKLSLKFQSLKVGARVQSVQEKYVRAFKEEEHKLEMMHEKSRKEFDEAKKESTLLSAELQYQAEQSYYERAKRSAKRTFGIENHDHQALAKVQYSMQSAKEREAALEAEYKTLERKLKEQTDQTKKAELVASEIAKLMKILSDAVKICKSVGEHFQIRAKYFEEISAFTTGEQLAREKDLTIEAGQMEADGLAKQKEFLEKYHRTMSIISSSYNFQVLEPQASFLPEGLQMQSKLLGGLGIEMTFD